MNYTTLGAWTMTVVILAALVYDILLLSRRKPRGTKIKNLIFDMDDTLVPCGRFYKEVKDTFTAFQLQRRGMQRNITEAMLNSIDLACTNMADGFNRSRYPRSFAAVSIVNDVVNGFAPDMIAAEQSFNIGNEVFKAPYDAFPGVIAMLTELKAVGYNIVLFTKGDPEVQQTKIDRNNFMDVFGEDNVHIVPRKNSDVLAAVLARHGFDPAETMMVGDSLKDDIGSALPLGVTGVWVGHGKTNKWGYEDASHTPHHALDAVTDLPTIL